jgi:hypothetical protein
MDFKQVKTKKKKYKDENGDEYEIITYEDLFDQAEKKMFSLKGEEIDYLHKLFIDNELEIEDSEDFLTDFLDLCVGKSSYIDIEIKKSINELEEEEK